VQHAEAASHRTPPFADAYATDVFAALPQRAVLITWTTERSLVLFKAQQDGRQRRDVDVVLGQQMTRPWYRSQVRDRLHVAIADRPSGNWFDEMATLASQLRGRRPVYVDLNAMLLMGNRLGMREFGLVAEVVDGKGRQPTDRAAWEKLVDNFSEPGIYTHPGRLRFPTKNMVLIYGYAHYDLALALANAKDFAGASKHVDLALGADPENPLARALKEKLAAAPTG
jgi:hypothetical protein